VRSNGTYDNFGMAMSHNLEALVTQYGLSNIHLKVMGTTGPAPLPVCFSADAMIETDRGLVRAGDLVAGDMVRTRDSGFQPVRWVGAQVLTFMPFSAASLRPVRINAGALGDGLPVADLVVSPQHRVLVRSNIAQKMFGTDEVLVAAKQLLQIDGIDIAEDLAEVTYVHFLFDQHEIVFANGAESESLFTGPQALKVVGSAALEEIFAIFPELRDRDYTPEPARVLASGRMGRKLAVRHNQNGKPLVM
ncbi:MAG: Hint domain-containing protein, partial [Paracoccus sp. (in: a-proteobacteria)]|nr:Hint domain-containing protein [Paracoccus sp. (in: a-proteobacteria)]